MRALALLLAGACASLAWADGPGSRLRTTPQVPVFPQASSPAPAEDTKRCDPLPREQRERCLADSRAAIERRPSGPEGAGGGSGAGSSSSTGTTGGGSFGGSAPR
jgi:hypothetical protein